MPEDRYSYWVKFIDHIDKTEFIIYSKTENQTYITDKIYLEEITTADLVEIFQSIIKEKKLPPKYPMKPC